MAVINVRQNQTSTSSQDEVTIINNSIDALTIDNLTDTNLTGLADNDLLQYNSSTNKWEPKSIDEVGSNVSVLNDLTDVDAASPVDGYALIWNDSTSTWQPQEISIVQSIDDLSDVSITSAVQNDIIVYDNGEFINGTISFVDGGNYGDIGTGVTVTGTRVLNYWEEDANGHLLPAATNTFNIGSPTRQVNELYLNSNTIYLDGVPISVDGSRQLRVDGNSVEGFSGNYNDLTNKPQLFSGNYNDLSGKPQIFSGNYNDLTNKPNLADNFSGSYNDLVDKPTIFDGDYNNLTNKPTIFDGNYNNLTNKPSIPSNTVSTSDLQTVLNLIKDNFTSVNDITDFIFGENGETSITKNVEQVTVDVEMLYDPVWNDWTTDGPRTDIGTNRHTFNWNRNARSVRNNYQLVSQNFNGIYPSQAEWGGDSTKYTTDIRFWHFFYITVTGFGTTDTYVVSGTSFNGAGFGYNRRFYPVIQIDFNNLPVELTLNFYGPGRKPRFLFPEDQKSTNNSSTWDFEFKEYDYAYPFIDRIYSNTKYRHLPNLDASSITYSNNGIDFSCKFDFSNPGFVYHGLENEIYIPMRRQVSASSVNRANPSGTFTDSDHLPLIFDIINNKQYADLNDLSPTTLQISSQAIGRRTLF